MRLVLFYLILVLVQGFLTALLSPLPAPDLFLLALLTLLGRLPAWQLVLLGYAVGLTQDLIGHGVLGLHALALAGAALAANGLRAQLSQAGYFERMMMLLAALAGKWIVLAGLLLWLSPTPMAALTGALPIVPLDVAFTLLAGLWVLPWGEALLERASVLRKELL